MNGKVIAFPARERLPEIPVHADARELNLDALAARIDYQKQREQPTQNAHGVHVGDLFYDSWGYEQTNIDFYQVVALKGKATAIIRKIAGEYIGGYAMSGNVRPIRNAFDGAETFQRRTRTGYNGKPEIGSPRGDKHHLWPTSDDTKHGYSSYY